MSVAESDTKKVTVWCDVCDNCADQITRDTVEKAEEHFESEGWAFFNFGRQSAVAVCPSCLATAHKVAKSLRWTGRYIEYLRQREVAEEVSKICHAQNA